jgi:hypothetical protein
VKGLKETGRRLRVAAICLARRGNEAMFRGNPELIAKAFDQLAEATMRLSEVTHLLKSHILRSSRGLAISPHGRRLRRSGVGW